MNRLIRDYIRDYTKKRLKSVSEERASCEHRKDLLLDEINYFIRHEDVCKAVLFLNSFRYQENLDEISSLNEIIPALREKETKLITYPFNQ